MMEGQGLNPSRSEYSEASHLTDAIGERICFECWEKHRKEQARIDVIAETLENLDVWIELELEKCGIPVHNRKADPALVPIRIKKQLPKGILESLKEGNLPKHGFGLGGKVGGGKTCCIVALLKLFGKAYGQKEIPKNPWATINQNLLFVNWPLEVDWIRKHATDDETIQRIEWIYSVPLLILDDVGRERIRGNYSEDWAANQLDVITNRRECDELPTIWTTNVSGDDLLTLYGSPMLDRLAGNNPLIWIDELKSLRGTP